MKITTSQLKRIIKEEVENMTQASKKKASRRSNSMRDEVMSSYEDALQEFCQEIVDSCDEPFDDEQYDDFVENAIVDFMGIYEAEIEEWQEVLGMSLDEIEQDVRSGIEMAVEDSPSYQGD